MFKSTKFIFHNSMRASTQERGFLLFRTIICNASWALVVFLTNPHLPAELIPWVSSQRRCVYQRQIVESWCLKLKELKKNFVLLILCKQGLGREMGHHYIELIRRKTDLKNWNLWFPSMVGMCYQKLLVKRALM